MALRIPTVSSCLGFISLRTGSKLFGFFSLITNILLASNGISFLIDMAWMLSRDEFKELILPIAIDLMFESMQMTTSILLVMAAYLDKPSFIPPWLVGTVLTAVAEVFYISNIYHTFFIFKEFSVGWIIITILTLFDDVYGWLVVYSYYHTLIPQAV